MQGGTYEVHKKKVRRKTRKIPTDPVGGGILRRVPKSRVWIFERETWAGLGKEYSPGCGSQR